MQSMSTSQAIKKDTIKLVTIKAIPVYVYYSEGTSQGSPTLQLMIVPLTLEDETLTPRRILLEGM